MDPRIDEQLRDFFARKGMLLTLQRKAIVQAAFGTREHFTADQLLLMAQKLNKYVGRATVYRTLTILVESGLLREMDFCQAEKFYDPNYIDRPHHHHLLCLDCGRVMEFEDERFETIENEVTDKLGFASETKTIRIEARCKQLKATGSCEHRRISEELT